MGGRGYGSLTPAGGLVCGMRKLSSQNGVLLQHTPLGERVSTFVLVTMETVIIILLNPSRMKALIYDAYVNIANAPFDSAENN